MAARTSLEIDDALLPKLPPEPQEVIEGVPVPVAPTGFVHGSIEWQIGWVLGSFVQSHQLGEVVVGDVLWHANGAMMPGDDAVLDLDPTVPGFQCQVSELFPPDLLPAPGRPKS